MVKFEDLPTGPLPGRNYKHLNLRILFATLLLAFHFPPRDFDEWLSITINGNVRLIRKRVL